MSDIKLDMKEFASQMKELEIKASKYDDLKENLDNVIGKINEKFNEIQDLFAEISPLLSLKKKYKKNLGGSVVIDYIEKCYRFLVESGAELTIVDLSKELGFGNSFHGGTEHLARQGLLKLHGIKTRIDSQDRRKTQFYFDKSAGKIKTDIITHIKEVIQPKEELGELKVEESGEELKDVLPKKFSHIG